jgi:diguanylate cyclase (GGDEF)-like protein
MIKYDPLTNVKRNLRVIKLVTIVLMAVLIINALISIYLLRKNSIQDRSSQLANLTIILSEHTAQTLFSANTALKSIHDAIKLKKIDTEKAYINFASKREQFDLLEQKTNSNSILDVSTFVASDGRVMNFSRSYPPPVIDLSERDYFQYLSTHNDPSVFYSVPVKNKGNGKWVFYLAQRLNGKNDQFLGLILVGISVEVFSSLYERIGGNLGDGSAISLYRADKTLLTRWPLVPEQIGKINTGSFIAESLASSQTNDGVIFASGAGFNRQNAEPVQRMISYREVKGYPFIVGAVIPESIYSDNWKRNTVGVFLATIFSILTLLLGSYFLSRTYRRDAINQYRANHDELTQLPNRSLFSDRLRQALTISKRTDSKLAILFIDLDNLKKINDYYGHKVGDAVLKQVALRIQSSIRESDTLARLGGDEFIILLAGFDSTTEVTHVAEMVRKALLDPLELNGQSIQTSASIGIAIYPDHGDNEIDLMNYADLAMYAAKSNGRNQIKLFSNGLIHEDVKLRL